ncbi:MAG: GNAT family N-acetyltransferase [Pseudomonadota bacterium]
MIRLAVLSDVDDIARLHVKTWQSAYRGHMPDAYLDGLDSSKRATMWSKAVAEPATVVLVATVAEILVGFCSLLPSRDADTSPSVGEVTAIYVDPNFWRSGLGTSLIQAAFDSARQRSLSEVTLWVLTANISARAFYEARGFKTDGQTKTEQRPGFSIHETRYRRPL